MLSFLAEQPLLALFLIMAVGLAVGKVSAWGVSLGAAAAMFVALGLSTANPDIAIPPFVYQFGLALFVYVIGLNFGQSFFRDFLSRGWKLSLLIVIMLLILAGVTIGFLHAFDLSPAIAVGTLAGSISSTPGMAAAVEALGGDSTPVVGYSLTYPGCVIGTIIVAAIGAKLLKVNHIDDAKAEGMIAAPLEWKVCVWAATLREQSTIFPPSLANASSQPDTSTTRTTTTWPTRSCRCAKAWRLSSTELMRQSTRPSPYSAKRST